MFEGDFDTRQTKFAYDHIQIINESVLSAQGFLNFLKRAVPLTTPTRVCGPSGGQFFSSAYFPDNIKTILFGGRSNFQSADFDKFALCKEGPWYRKPTLPS